MHKANSFTSTRTIAETSSSCKNLTDFNIESFFSDERFSVKNVLIVRSFVGDDQKNKVIKITSN